MFEAISGRIAGWAGGKPSGPYRVQAHLTNFCNMKCVFCPTKTLVPEKELRRGRELDASAWAALVDEGRGLGVAEWHLCGGGEPLLFKDVALAVVRKIKDAGCRGEVITNGAVIDAATADLFVRSGWELVTVSLDGHDSRTNDALRGEGAFERIMDGVERLVKRRKAARAKLPRVSFHMVVCRENFAAVPEMVRLAARKGVDGVLVNALNVWSEEMRQLSLGQDEIEQLREGLMRASKEAAKLGVGNNFESFLRNDLFRKANLMHREMKAEAKRQAGRSRRFSGAPCFYPWYNISIFADGTARPCFLLRKGGAQVRDRGLGAAWTGKSFDAVRRKMLCADLGEDCSRCNPWSLAESRELRKRLMEEGL